MQLWLDSPPRWMLSLGQVSGTHSNQNSLSEPPWTKETKTHKGPKAQVLRGPKLIFWDPGVSHVYGEHLTSNWLPYQR